MDTMNDPFELLNYVSVEKARENISVIENGISMINRKECDIRETAKALYLDMKPNYERSRGQQSEHFIKLQMTVYCHVANGHNDKAMKSLQKYIKYTDGQKEKLQKYLTEPYVGVEGGDICLFNHETVPVWTKKLTVECELMTLMVKGM